MSTYFRIRQHCLLRCDAHYTHCSFHSLLCFNTIHCKYATPLIFFNVYRIFFGFRAFYLFFIQILAVILHRNSKSSHVHRTFIALPSHTRTRVTAMRRSGSAKARSSSLRLFQMRFARSRWLQKKILFNFAKFCSLK